MMNASRSYLVAQIQSATPGGLIVLLYDGLLRFTQEAEERLADTDPTSLKQAADAVQRATDILTELASSLREDQNPELCATLSQLYAFFTTELSRALHSRDASVITPLLPLITQLRDTWQDAEGLAYQKTGIAATG